MYKKKICVVTGTRAEYGLLYWFMKHIKNDKNLKLQLIVTGMHLVPEFGNTINQILQDKSNNVSPGLVLILKSALPFFTNIVTRSVLFSITAIVKAVYPNLFL